MMDYTKLFGVFIKNRGLSLPIIQKKDYIDHAVKSIGIESDWLSFCERVENRFGNYDGYSDYYKKVKESFLDYVKSDPAFKEFNSRDMNEFKIERPNNIPKDIYSKNNDDNLFISIDLKKANFQALKYCGVFKEFDTWEDLIGKFTDFPDLISSKYLRSVLFGQLNPGRHITVESYLINSLRPYFSNQYKELKLEMMASDELVYSIPDINSCQEEDIQKEIKGKFGLTVTADIYKLKRHALVFSESKKEVEFYSKIHEKDIQKPTTLHCIPSTYYLLAYKLFRGDRLYYLDYLLEHDGIFTRIIENVSLS